jgi:hypothetical protein
VAVHAVELGADLYRIGTPAGSGLTPVTTAGTAVIRAALRPTGDVGPDTVDVRLRTGVRWDLVLRAGAGEFHLDLAAARLTGLTVLGGAGAVRLWLPRPEFPVPIRLGPGIGDADLYLPAGVELHTDYLLDSRAAVLRVHT